MDTQNTSQDNSPEQQPAVSLVPPNSPQPVQASSAANLPSETHAQNYEANMQMQVPVAAKPHQLTENAEKLKRLSIQVMIVSLIGAAVLAVIAVLAGSFNQVFEKALFTLFLVMVHALACLAFVEQTGTPKSSNFKFFENAVFVIIVLSFFTSIFGMWRVLGEGVIIKLYGTYLILLFACLHGQMLVQTRGKQTTIDSIVSANYVIMGLVILLLLPIIWVDNSVIPDPYYRLLAASGIIDGTLTVIAVILYKLYVQKHPEVQSTIFSNTINTPEGVPTRAADQKRHIHPLIWLLVVYIMGQFVLSLLFAARGAFFK